MKGVHRRIVVLPVSSSTSTSTSIAANDPPTPPGLTPALPTIGPPVPFEAAAISLKVSLSSGSDLCWAIPSAYSTSSSLASHTKLALFNISFLTSCAASNAAQPDLKATPLPPVTDVYPMESVSATCGLTSSTGMERTSASCCDIAVLEPPTSTEPSERLTAPSGVTVATHAAGPVLFLQYPKAIPLPLNLPSTFSKGVW